ncbi:MAG: PilW family protein [Oleispira sp.]|nr:PilW family protein [Oleispira sp.]
MNMTRFRKTQGFTLIELMITLVLSLMITYSIAQVLISSNHSSVSSDGISQSQETGRFVMSYLANNIRQSGLDSVPSDDGDDDISIPAFIDCTTFSTLAANQCIGESNTDNADDPNVADTELTIHSAGSHGDRLAVAWVPPVPVNAAGVEVPALFATNVRDCTGRAVYVKGDIILNVFWVQSDPNNPDPLPSPPDLDNPTMNNLVCQAYKFNGGIATEPSDVIPIANGIESMQILYGESLNPLPIDTQDRNVNQYVTGAAVTNWNRVYAVRIAILTRSLIAITSQTAVRNYVLLDAQPYVMNDAVSRQVFTTTFVINNI